MSKFYLAYSPINLGLFAHRGWKQRSVFVCVCMYICVCMFVVNYPPHRHMEHKHWWLLHRAQKAFYRYIVVMLMQLSVALYSVALVITQATPFALIPPGRNLKLMAFPWLKKWHPLQNLLFICVVILYDRFLLSLTLRNQSKHYRIR